MSTLVVQQSFPEPRPTTNPYLWMLAECLRADPDVEVRTFSWRAALLRRYDVFHVHWPEILVGGQSPSKAVVRQGLTLLLLAKLRVTRTPLVRTVHNVAMPEGLSWRQRRILQAADRQTALRIRLNTMTELPPEQPFVTILHGHYRDWYGDAERADQVPGRLAYFGLIRRYKGVDTLLRAFRALPGEVSLEVGGSPSSPELARTVEELASGDPRIHLDLRFLPDADLVSLVSRSVAVVLPYREMHNSGSALSALSLDRPVVVPRNRANDLLREEVGEQWVFSFDGELTADVIADVLKTLSVAPPPGRPDLSGREWADAGNAHVGAYRQAQALLRGTR